jgi:hypothetical protein
MSKNSGRQWHHSFQYDLGISKIVGKDDRVVGSSVTYKYQYGWIIK